MPYLGGTVGPHRPDRLTRPSLVIDSARLYRPEPERQDAMSEQVDALFLAFQKAVAGRYSLERELGRGGMGVVYLAREVRLDRLVAIKLLPPDLAAQASLRDRFMREATTAARLSHPYIVPIHAVDEIGGFVFIVMAYVDGETLAQRVASRGPLSPEDVTRMLREVSWALAYAHAQGVVHRDVKPANILLERGTQRAMIADFGIARLTQTSGMTAVGELVGTPEFMSPEQASGEPVDGRSDLYSLGVVGFYALSGALPFTAPSAQAVLAQHLTRSAPSVAALARGAPRSLSQAIDRCLEKDPAARFPTGEALADGLAAAMVKRAEIPVPVRVFLDRKRLVLLILPAVLGSQAALVLTRLAPPLHIGGFVLAGLLVVGWPVAVTIKRLRTLLRRGYGPDDLVAGARLAFDRHREEFLYEFGPEASVRERLFRVLVPVCLTVGAVAGLAAIAGVARPFLAPIAVVNLYAGLMTSIVGAKWSRLRRGSSSLLMKVVDGRLMRGLARIAGYRLGSRSIPANRPTELMIAMTAEGLYDALPKELRQSLGDVPEVLRGLEAHARTARARMEQLDAAIGEAQGGSGRAANRQDALVNDLRAARAAAEARLGDVVTALETVRLDLLRLGAGAGSVEGITSDLAAARELGENADRLLAGVREVEAVLADTPA
jgi:eukaryotic-like serine/threonine-protein kinase